MGVVYELIEDCIGEWAAAEIFVPIVDWHLSPKMSLGIDICNSQADVTVFDEEIKAGGLHTGITLGYRW